MLERTGRKMPWSKLSSRLAFVLRIVGSPAIIRTGDLPNVNAKPTCCPRLDLGYISTTKCTVLRIQHKASDLNGFFGRNNWTFQ
jgi:hypothetical protein